VVEIKFCGMTRAADAAEAAKLGARYVGAILAESPRRLTESDAKQVLSGASQGPARVAVFGPAPAAEIAASATRAGANIVQLHGDPSPQTISDVRAVWNGEVWAVLRVNGSGVPASAAGLFDAADAVVLDARVEGKLGGTGVALAWDSIAPQLKAMRGRRARLVLAGGLSPENVARAIKAVAPDVVDVSSGVESSPGVKDHARMQAFRDAVAGVSR
jgi:phosphoribosylanthranilate isomerase